MFSNGLEMDVVVVLALVVLAVVFLVSFSILVTMCYRRKMNNANEKSSPLRFSKLVENSNNIESLGQLSPLIGELLDRNTWMYDASGIMQHCVAILRLCRTLTDKLATVPLTHSSQPISEAICMATRNIFPRFDDLLEVVSSNTVDIRVLEARAMSLGTVCWSLYLPFTMLNAKNKDILNKPLSEMNLHLRTIRTACDLAIAADQSQNENTLDDVKKNLEEMRHKLRGKTLVEEDEDDVEEDDDVDEPSTSGDTNEMTPLVSSKQVHEAVIDCVPLDESAHSNNVINNTPSKQTNGSALVKSKPLTDIVESPPEAHTNNLQS